MGGSVCKISTTQKTRKKHERMNEKTSDLHLKLKLQISQSICMCQSHIGQFWYFSGTVSDRLQFCRQIETKIDFMHLFNAIR